MQHLDELLLHLRDDLALRFGDGVDEHIGDMRIHKVVRRILLGGFDYGFGKLNAGQLQYVLDKGETTVLAGKLLEVLQVSTSRTGRIYSVIDRIESRPIIRRLTLVDC